MAIISSCVQTFVDLNEISIGDIPPISPSNNQLWFCTKDNGTFLNNMLYKYNSSANKWDIVNDYTDEILEAIKDLNVTSRNLLSDTAVSKSLLCTGITNQCGAKYSLVKSVDYLKHLRNNKLTYAFDWEYIGDNPSGTFVAQTAGPQWTQISKTITISADNYWGTCVDTVTFTSENPFIEIGIRADNVIGTIKITHPRLVFGEKDLGWSQAPEDLEEKFTTIFNRTDKGIYMEHSGEGTTGLIDVNNKAIKISAPSLFLEGYTTINEHFKILSTGDIEGTNAKFNGTITSGGTISGTAISGGTLIGSTIQNAIDNPTFKVTPTGAMTASNATIKGTISGSIISGETFTSANNKFKVLGNGTLEATEANITGSISAGSTITGSTVIGSTIQNAATNPTFIVSNTGNIKGAVITGSSFQNSEISPTFKVDVNGRVDASNMNITGGSLNVGSNFNVSNTGILTAKSANFTGSINAGSTITGSVIQNAVSNPTFKIDASGNITGGSININNAFNVSSAGKLIATGAEISGKVTIGSGSTVPTSYLSGTVSSSQLDKTITDDISTAKTNSSNAVSILDGNKVNWSTAYKQIESWAESTPTGTTEFDGNKIKTGTIFANKMAVGDFTNICQVDENRNPIIFSKILNTSTTEVVTLSNKKYFKFGHATTAGYYGLILINDMQIIKSGDVFKFSCMGYTTSAEIRLVIRATYTDGTYTDLGGNLITATSTDTPINIVLKITNDIDGTKIIKDICCLIYNNNKIGLTYLRSISINRMSTGELIVDGSITSGMIHTDGLNANTIKAGTLDSARIASNSITTQHLAIGDFTNYCPLTPDNCSTYGYTKVVDGNNSWIQLPIARDVGLCKDHYATYTGNVEGTYYIEFEVSSNAQGEITKGAGDIGYMTLGLGAYCKTKDGASAWYVMSKIKSNSTNSIQKTSGYIIIPDNIASFGVAFQHGGWSSFTGTTKIRNIKFNKMTSGELVVDGAITGNKIAANSITADKITIGDFVNYCNQPINYTMMNGQPAYYMGVQSTQGYTVSSNIYQLKGGEQFNISGQIYAPPGNGGQTNFNLYFYWVGSTNNILDSSVAIQAAPQGTTKDLNLMINIPARPVAASYGYFRATCGNAAYNLYWINPTIRLMMSGELIVDGAITANKITIGDGVASSGNLAAGLTTSGTIVTTNCTDGQKAIGTAYVSCGSGSGTNNSVERDYIQLDLGATKILSESRIYFFSADNRYYFYKIKYSSDGTNWYYAVGKSSNDGWMTSTPAITMTNGFENPTINTFSPAISARYIRLYSNGNTVNGGNHIYEWELYSQSTTQISGNQITTGKLTASSGGSYLDLNNGSMMLGSTSSTNYLQWTGSSLNIKADSLSLKTGGSVATMSDVEGLQLKFSQNENQNLLYNGDFKNGFTNWTNSGSNTIINTASCPTNMNSIRMIGQLGVTKQVYQELRDINYAGQLFLGFWAYVSNTGAMGTTNALLAAQLMLEYTDGTKVYPLVALYSKFDTWERRTLILTPPTGKRIKSAFLGIYNRDTTKEAYVTDVIVAKSGIEVPFSQNPNEMYDGIIDLNKTGITVTASNANTKTIMNTDGFFLKKTDGTNLFKVDSAGLEMTGKVTAVSGQIAGFNINGNSLWGGGLGLAGPEETQQGIAIWAGNTIPERAPLTIMHDGSLMSSGINGNFTVLESGSLGTYSEGASVDMSGKIWITANDTTSGSATNSKNANMLTHNSLRIYNTGIPGSAGKDYFNYSCDHSKGTGQLSMVGRFETTGSVNAFSFFTKASSGDTERYFHTGGFGGDSVYGSTQGVAYLGNCIIIYGNESFTNLTANEVKTATIKFRVSFAVPPFISLTGNTSVPHICDMGASSVTSTQFNLNFRRTNTTDTTVFWCAIGQRG